MSANGHETSREHGEETASSAQAPDQDLTLTFAAPQKIAGRYRIEACLGSGGFGSVYRAYDELLGRIVCLKVVSLEKADGEEKSRLEAALKEARTVARLDHPNIVPVYDVGIEANNVWMAMRLVEGESLAAILKDAGRISLERTVPVLRQVAGALDHAHGRGVIHRDVKPSNILLERRGGTEHVWLLDFGIAKMLTGQTLGREGALVGTPGYMAPEQVTGKKVDGRTDIFALGCVACELITGNRAFPGSTYAEVLYSVIHQQPEGLSELAALAGNAFESLVRRALAKAPEDRFQAAGEMLRALDEPARDKALGDGKRKVWSIFRMPFRGARPACWDGRDVLVARELMKRYKFRRKALDGITLNVPAGSIYALLGRNGSGKTTFIRTVLGIYRQDSGAVAVFGRDPHREGPAILSRIGYVPESLAAYDTLTVGRFISLLRAFYPRWDNAYCYQLLGRYELPLDVKIRELSKGMKTKVSLVGALAHRPEFLVLDDPTVGLDAATTREVFETLQEACQREAATVLISSHNLDEVEAVATHIAFIEKGRLLLSDTLAGLRTRTREVTLTFRDAVPDLRGIPHFKVVKSSAGRVTGLLLDTSSQAIPQLEALRPERLQVKELNLKEFFVDFLREATRAQN